MKDYKLRRTILCAMTNVGRIAHVREIAAALGPEWLAAGKLAALRQMLKLLDRETLVTRVGATSYVNCGFGSGGGGFGTPEQIADHISAYLQECGGVRPTEDILEWFADRRLWGPDEQDDQRLRIRQIIAESGRFRLAGEADNVVSLTNY